MSGDIVKIQAEHWSATQLKLKALSEKMAELEPLILEAAEQLDPHSCSYDASKRQALAKRLKAVLSKDGDAVSQIK
ncbi:MULTISPECIES: hypothetical protein [unclassified Pseudoalteromonas]|uniref:hypothetical protein n=1 Tax=unclassified Pseudoalteromonas TaxID=194690 RepID=UPI00209858C6|nr:hypothetical protein [Pseudoalteromonas sp. XMcav2-N]MCO7190353.1 hypothetical protein [Pseudoalteromonas sp. XMcav2-N]